jgi:hypothetical protein
MNDEERQRTMDFILQQQAQFTVGMQKLEEADTRASRRLDRLERTLALMARRFRRERDDLQERMTALVDAQIRTEEAAARMEEAVRSLTATTGRNSKDIEALSKKDRSKAEGESEGEPS